jgi:hypothetical protein
MGPIYAIGTAQERISILKLTGRQWPHAEGYGVGDFSMACAICPTIFGGAALRDL